MSGWDRTSVSCLQPVTPRRWAGCRNAVPGGQRMEGSGSYGRRVWPRELVGAGVVVVEVPPDMPHKSDPSYAHY